MKRIVWIVIGFIILLPAQLILAEEYNFGLQLLFSPPVYSTFGTIYSFEDSDKNLTNGNEEYLALHYKDRDGHEYNNDDFGFWRNIKLFNLDSVFITVYGQNWHCHDHLFLLSDLTSGQKIVLNRINIDEFNLLIQNQFNKKEPDYLYFTRLYIVLSNIVGRIYFVESPLDIVFAADSPEAIGSSIGYWNFHYDDKILDTYDKYINNSCVEIGDTIVVNQCVYSQDDREVTEYKMYFVELDLINIDSLVAISKEQIKRLFK